MKTTAQLKAEARKAAFSKSYKGLGKKASQSINNTIMRGIFNQKSIEGMAKSIADLLGVSKQQASQVVRGEYQAIKNVIRGASEEAKDPAHSFKYKWLSIPDSRRTKYCTIITNRTKHGVSLERLKEIIKQESDKAIYDENRPFTPHVGCRSTFVRVF